MSNKMNKIIPKKWVNVMESNHPACLKASLRYRLSPGRIERRSWHLARDAQATSYHGSTTGLGEEDSTAQRWVA